MQHIYHLVHLCTGMNSMIKVLIKKGLVTDLARIAHSLDLSSPYMVNTINSALKPLETISRIGEAQAFLYQFLHCSNFISVIEKQN